MEVVCPNCGAGEQFAGKFCENCGYAIPVDVGATAASPQPGPTAAIPPVDPAVGAVTPASQPAAVTGTAPQVGVQQGDVASQIVGAQFAVVRDGQPNLNEGFTITIEGEFLVGRMDQETGQQVDVDLRQWVQPLDVDGHKQYLVHRKQCYLSLTDGDVVAIKPCPGSEADTLVRGPGEGTFTSLQNLADKRPPRPDGSFELQLHDQIYMGDPDAVMYYVSGDPTAQGHYVVIEMINKS